MARIHTTLAMVTLLASAPLLAAEPAGVVDRVSADTPAESTHVYRTGTTTSAPTPVPQLDSPAPATPVPMNLPDDAQTHELTGQYGVGLAGMILGAIVVVAIIVGFLFFISRRSWSTSH